MQKIISWNVASVRARLPVLSHFLTTEQPDFVLLQEIKATEDNFPKQALLDLGYHVILSGQKSFNGVAILSKETLSDPVYALPHFQDQDPPQARYCQATAPNGITYICVYVPNGNPPEKDPLNTDKLSYKLRWMDAFNQHMEHLLSEGRKIILGGDFNVIEKDTDVYNPEPYRTNALMLPPVREAFSRLQKLPLTNMIRTFNPDPHTYSFWDFQWGAWRKNYGMLLDALFVSNNLKDHIKSAKIYKEIRDLPKTSDHAPIGCELQEMS